MVEYDYWSGAAMQKYTYQGYADNSTWARGQAWALGGFATLANDTSALSKAQRTKFTEVAIKLADAWLGLLGNQNSSSAKPAKVRIDHTSDQSHDFIPRWDFNAPYEAMSDGPRDSSAAAIAALGLLRLADALGPDTSCGAKYLAAAQATLRALASERYLAAGAQNSKHEAILMHAVANKPANMSVDAGLPYGDYYFMLALRSCKDMRECYNN